MPPERFRLAAAVYGVLTDRDKVLLMRRRGTGYHDGELGLPSGHLDGNEDAVTGLIRELEEELGIVVEGESCQLSLVMHRPAEWDGDDEYIDLVFTVGRWDGSPHVAEPDKCSELVWAPHNQLPPDTVDYIRKALVAIAAGHSLVLHGWNRHLSPPEPLESQLDLAPRSQPFQPGEQVVVVEMCCAKPWTVRPVTVVADDEHAGVVLWLAGGTMTRYPAGPQHGRHTVPRWLTGDWELIDREWVGPGVLMLCRLGQQFEVRVTPEVDSEPWYVNLTEPWRRVASGFVTMDQTLDLLVARDLSGWSWKDEDEFAYAQQIGVYSTEQAHEIRSIGNDVIARAEAGDPPWDAAWAMWTPDTLSSTIGDPHG